MTPERWRQIHDLCERLWQCPAGERQRYLDRVRAEDAILADEVANLLRHDARASDERFLDATCPVNVKSHWSAAGADRLIGRCFGPYEIQPHIASGGMGDVYRAARLDDYQQTVTLKVIRNGLLDGPAIRFRQDVFPIFQTWLPPSLVQGGFSERAGVASLPCLLPAPGWPRLASAPRLAARGHGVPPVPWSTQCACPPGVPPARPDTAAQ